VDKVKPLSRPASRLSEPNSESNAELLHVLFARAWNKIRGSILYGISVRDFWRLQRIQAVVWAPPILHFTVLPDPSLQSPAFPHRWSVDVVDMIDGSAVCRVG
jgi:hypothetical protein